MIFCFTFLLLSIIIAVYTRYIDIDRFFRHYEPRARLSHIAWSNSLQPSYQLTNGAYILQDWLFRVGSTVEPPITLQTKLRADGTLIVMDGSGQELSLGTAVYDPLDNLAQAYTVAIDPGDQAVFQVSRSVIPYYYGWRIFSPAPLFRYFRYYSLSIRQANGANLKVEWKFTTYRTPDGSWTPDAYGWRGEGLVRLELQMAK